MPRIETTEGFQWAERFAYILLAVLLFTWAFMSDIEMDFRLLGLGYVDPLFTLGVMWIGIVFIMKGTIAMLQRRSYRAMSDEWKGPLTDIKPYKIIEGDTNNKGIAVNELTVVPTGGTSKPSVRGFTGIRFLVFPHFYSTIIGGYVIIMTKMHSYPKESHGDILPHIINSMNKLKGFRLNHTRIVIGENPDPKWPVNVDGEWVIKEEPSQILNLVEEASVCRKYNDFNEDAYRSREQLKAFGYRPEED